MKYRVIHPPNQSYTEFLSMEDAIAFRDANYPNATIIELEIPPFIPD